MRIEETGFSGLRMIRPDVFQDHRGFFLESWNEKAFRKAGINTPFVQDNLSCSHRHVIRGFHFQVPPWEQAKLVTVLNGTVLDVVVDLRRDQPTFGKHFKITLAASDHSMLYIPAGFAHGFMALEDHSLFAYKCSRFYQPGAEKSLRWNDPDLAIDWGVSDPVLSEKDKAAPLFRELRHPF